MLKPGEVAYAKNMRFDRGTARVRDGLKIVVDDVVLDGPPVALDFTLGEDISVTSITRAGTTATVVTATAHGATNGQLVNILGADQSEYNGDHAITVVHSKSFTFLVASSAITPATGTIVANAGPIVQEDYSGVVRGAGLYSASEIDGAVIASTVSAYLYRYDQATATIGFSGAETVTADDDCDIVQFAGKVYMFRGTDKRPLVWDGSLLNSFTPASSSPLTGTLVPLPNVSWGVPYKGRMFIPYKRDELLISDILNAESYDTIYSQLKIQAGTEDYLVGVHPYQENRILVLYRRSVHILTLDDSDLSVSRVYEITRNVGCAARRTAVTCGNSVLWLSDNGVYSMDVTAELNLRGNQTPLSDPIDDQIQGINWKYAHRAVATYYNNRYYLAVPTSGAEWPNAIFIYNFLNRAWEGIDTFGYTFDISSFVTMNYDGRKRLHAVSRYGVFVLMEEGTVDEIAGFPGEYSDVSGELYTRDYTAGTNGSKRFKRANIETHNVVGGYTLVRFRSRNPDVLRSVPGGLSSASAGEASNRLTLGQRGVYGRFELVPVGAGTEVRSVSVEASDGDRRTTTFE
jgi:hypothetical protein